MLLLLLSCPGHPGVGSSGFALDSSSAEFTCTDYDQLPMDSIPDSFDNTGTAIMHQSNGAFEGLMIQLKSKTGDVLWIMVFGLPRIGYVYGSGLPERGSKPLMRTTPSNIAAPEVNWPTACFKKYRHLVWDASKVDPSLNLKVFIQNPHFQYYAISNALVRFDTFPTLSGGRLSVDYTVTLVNGEVVQGTISQLVVDYATGNR